MILLIDAGNSAIKWNVSEAGSCELQNLTGTITYDEENIANQFEEHWQNLKGITGVWMSNVAGETIADSVQHWTQQHWQLAPQLVATSSEYKGIINAYTDYTKLGTDRWLTLLAAQRLYPEQAVCIIDCGTAITADLVAANGEHKGGLILPGPELMKNALTSNTDAINHAIHNEYANKKGDSEEQEDLKLADVAWGRNTRDCIKLGVDTASTAFINQAINYARQQTGQETQALITGGGSAQYLSGLAENCKYCPNLVLQGLSLIAGD